MERSLPVARREDRRAVKVKDLIFKLNSLLASGEAGPNDRVCYYSPFNRPVRTVEVAARKRSAAQRVRNQPVTKVVALN